MNRAAGIAATLLLGGCLSGCELAVIGAATGAAFSIAEDRRSPGTQLEDETIQVRAQARISERFGDKVHVTVTSFGHMVLLTGEAPDADARDEIGKIALGVPNVKNVANELQLAPPSSRTSRIGDEIITTKIKARLIDAGKVSLVHAKVVTEGGVVFLLGLVTEEEAEQAVEIARTTGGVIKVVKLFTYCKPTDEACRSRTPSAPKPAA